MDEHLLRFKKDKTLLFIDCETFNLCLNSVGNLPWQVGMIRTTSGFNTNIKKKWDLHIKWDTNLEIGEEAARITRFNPAKFESLAISPEKAFEDIERELDSCDYIVGHNILGFDIYLLKDYYNYMGKDYKHLMPKIIDTNSIAKGIKMDVSYQANGDPNGLLLHQYKMVHKRKRGVKTNLTALGKEFDIEHDYDNLHDAVVDLELNIKVWDKLKYMVDV
jgi:DNA polymerase III epsilon subunit-like protein